MKRSRGQDHELLEFSHSFVSCTHTWDQEKIWWGQYSFWPSDQFCSCSRRRMWIYSCHRRQICKFSHLQSPNPLPLEPLQSWIRTLVARCYQHRSSSVICLCHPLSWWGFQTRRPGTGRRASTACPTVVASYIVALRSELLVILASASGFLM